MLVKVLARNGIVPNCLKAESAFILIEIEEMNIRFLSHQNYLPGCIYDISKQFDITFMPNYFPATMLHLENLNYCGHIPTYEAFLSDFDDNETKLNKALFVKKFTSKWSFRYELLAYSQQKLFLLNALLRKF